MLNAKKKNILELDRKEFTSWLETRKIEFVTAYLLLEETTGVKLNL